MKVYVVLSDTSNVPFGIYDNFDKAKQYILAYPSIHLCIFEYDVNTNKPGNNIYDNYCNNIFSL
jgi:hypothetical protein